MRKGFTLLELMVVISVSGILAGIGVVSFVNVRQSTAVRLAAENFAGFLRTTESMTRSGTPFSGGARNICNNDATHSTTTPCGGYGVVVRSDGKGYYRYADLTPACITPVLHGKSVQSPCTTSTPLVDSTDMVTGLDSVEFADPILITSGTGTQVEFVPPKDGICLYDPSAISDKTQCGPWQSKTVVWTFGYGPTGSNYRRSVTLNTVSGSVMVK